MFSFCEVYNLFLSSESFHVCFVPLHCSWDKNTAEKRRPWKLLEKPKILRNLKSEKLPVLPSPSQFKKRNLQQLWSYTNTQTPIFMHWIEVWKLNQYLQKYPATLPTWYYHDRMSLNCSFLRDLWPALWNCNPIIRAK